MMDVQEEIRQYLSSLSAEIIEHKGILTAELVIAERKGFLSKRKLTYAVKLRVDQAAREVRFTEMLKESGWGLSGGDINSSPGFGYGAETYKTGKGPRQGSIEEYSNLFGKKYSFSFDFKTVRGTIEQKAQMAGFAFKYQILPLGL